MGIEKQGEIPKYFQGKIPKKQIVALAGENAFEEIWIKLVGQMWHRAYVVDDRTLDDLTIDDLPPQLQPRENYY